MSLGAAFGDFPLSVVASRDGVGYARSFVVWVVD